MTWLAPAGDAEQETVPAEVLRAATGHRGATALSCHTEPIGGSTRR